MSNPQQSVQFLPHAPVRSSQQIGWKGLLFQEYYHPRHEVPEYVMRQHMILVRLTRGTTQESRVDGKSFCRIQTEKGAALIVPAGVTNATVWKGDAEFLRLTVSP